jgi:hypothetical protein
MLNRVNLVGIGGELAAADLPSYTMVESLIF